MLNAFVLFAEGTKELRPAESDICNLLLLPYYSNFGLYDAPPAQQIRIKIASPGEKIFFGFNNKDGNDTTGLYGNDDGPFLPNIPFQITSPSGMVVYSSVIPGLGMQGNIPNWTQAVSGPLQLGNTTGYDAMQLTAAEAGDYVLSFNPFVATYRLNINLFDVTVVDFANKVQKGRLHCQGWQFSMTQFEIPFHAKIYPYDGKTAVYEVDMNGLAPLAFIVNFNSKGTANTGNSLEDRKSKIGNSSYPEFEVFLNPPDPVLYPTTPTTLVLTGETKRNDCTSQSYCFNVTVNTPGRLEGFIDFNKNGAFEAELGEIAFSEFITTAGTTCIPWNGQDRFGNVVKNDFNVVANFGYGDIHLPLYDAEDNWNGLKVKEVRPNPGNIPLLFWDDSYITAGTTLGDALVNLQGCNSAATGCHKWRDRGQKFGGSLAFQETINTWWYSAITTKILFYDNPLKEGVQLSLDASKLITNDTSVCIGDELPIYIYNDGKDHFNTTRYRYEWYMNGQPIAGDIRQQKTIFTDTTVFIVRAIDKAGLLCDTYDSLRINTIKPLRIKPVLNDPECNFSTASIAITIVEGPANPLFHWKEIPGNLTGYVTNLSNGTYHVRIKDDHYSDGCAFDTTFLIQEANGIMVDSIIKVLPNCYDTFGTGSATVIMNRTGNYQYAWDTVNFTNNATNSGLYTGSYFVKVKELVSGCTTLEPYQIGYKYFTFPVTAKDEVCNDTTGAITLHPQVSGLVVNWNHVTSTDLQRTHLDHGTYHIRAESLNFPACIFDTTIVLNDQVIPISIQQLLLTPSDCGYPNGTATVIMPADHRNYMFDWNGTGLQRNNSISDLPVGNHQVHVQIAGSQCMTDAALFIPGNGFDYELYGKDNFCDTKQGKALVTVKDPNVVIKWADDPTDLFLRTGLNTGKYLFRLKNNNDPACVADSFVTVTSKSYVLPVDFTYQFASDVYEINRNVIFTNHSNPIYTHKWEFSDGGTSIDYNTEHVFYMVKDQSITLIETDSNGCTGKLTRVISLSEIGDCGLALPTAFSPNNDAVNNTFGLLGRAYLIDFKLFNRWGEVIFRTKNVTDRWDASYRSEEAPIGVYPYTLEYQCPVGGGLKVFRKVGEITLVR